MDMIVNAMGTYMLTRHPFTSTAVLILHPLPRLRFGFGLVNRNEARTIANHWFNRRHTILTTVPQVSFSPLPGVIASIFTPATPSLRLGGPQVEQLRTTRS